MTVVISYQDMGLQKEKRKGNKGTATPDVTNVSPPPAL